jgi:hypothetical protein
VNLTESTLSGLDHGNAILRIPGSLIKPSDLPPHFLTDGQTGGIVTRPVDPQSG